MTKLRHENQRLEIELEKSTQATTLFEEIAAKDAGMTAKTLMNYLSYMFKGRPQIDPKAFELVKELFDRE